MPPIAHEVFIQQGSDLWTKLGTPATLLAVLAALFGPLLLDRIRRPRLVVSVASDLVAALARAPGSAGRGQLTIDITNQGRRQANDVQVFLSVETQVDNSGLGDVHRIEAFQSPVPFFHQEGGQWATQFSVAIPPGFSRPLGILVEDVVGFRLATATENPPNEPAPSSFGLDDGDRRVLLDIVGSNFRVVRVEGLLRVQNQSPDPNARWIKGPKVVRYRAGDPLPPG